MSTDLQAVDARTTAMSRKINSRLDAIIKRMALLEDENQRLHMLLDDKSESEAPDEAPDTRWEHKTIGYGYLTQDDDRVSMLETLVDRMQKKIERLQDEAATSAPPAPEYPEGASASERLNAAIEAAKFATSLARREGERCSKISDGIEDARAETRAMRANYLATANQIADNGQKISEIDRLMNAISASLANFAMRDELAGVSEEVRGAHASLSAMAVKMEKSAASQHENNTQIGRALVGMKNQIEAMATSVASVEQANDAASISGHPDNIGKALDDIRNLATANASVASQAQAASTKNTALVEKLSKEVSEALQAATETRNIADTVASDLSSTSKRLVLFNNNNASAFKALDDRIAATADALNKELLKNSALISEMQGRLHRGMVDPRVGPLVEAVSKLEKKAALPL